MDLEPVRDLNLSRDMKISDLIRNLSNVGGFQAQELYRAYEILREMFNDKNCIKVLSFPADIISTGIRGVIKDILRKKLFDIVITTAGTVDHDIARLTKDYYVGYFEADDIFLKEKGIMRLGNVFIPEENYGPNIESVLRPILREIAEEYTKKGIFKISTYELIWEIGKRLEKFDKKEESIIYWSYVNKIPIIIPGITDGAIGTQLLMISTEYSNFEISVWEDEKFLSKVFFGEKCVGALMLGGGISKHHVIWWGQFAGGLKYAVYITSAVEADGSLSGARTREAISWGKIRKNAKHVTVWGDITIILPLLLADFL